MAGEFHARVSCTTCGHENKRMKLKPVWTLDRKQETLHDPPDLWSVVHYCAECWAKMQGMTVDAAREEIWGQGGAKKRWRAGQFIRGMEVVREEYERSVVDPGTRDVCQGDATGGGGPGTVVISPGASCS